MVHSFSILQKLLQIPINLINTPIACILNLKKHFIMHAYKVEAKTSRTRRPVATKICGGGTPELAKDESKFSAVINIYKVHRQ